jgi:hypothetical protein
MKKNLLYKGIKFITDSDYRFDILSGLGAFNRVGDREYLERKFKAVMKKELDLENPQTFNEKLQWLKLYDRRPEYTIMVDKYRVRDYIAEKLGEEYLIPLLGVWDDPDDIDFDALPNQFVLKCNHNSGTGMCICKDKSKLDIKKVKKELKKGLKENYFLTGREWPYKDVPRKIICEKYMTDESGTELKDYKIHNFNGQPKFIEVDYNRFVEHKRNLYSTDWKYINATMQYPSDKSKQINKPECLDEMLSLASKLSQGIKYVRTDFYCINNKIYFGELTFYHGSGLDEFKPEEFGLEVGNWLKLPSGGQ